MFAYIIIAVIALTAIGCAVVSIAGTVRDTVRTNRAFREHYRQREDGLYEVMR